MSEHELKVLRVLHIAAIYIPFNCEAMTIQYWDTDKAENPEPCIYGEGEETGEQYQVPFSDVDFEKDMFYRLEVVDTSAV